MMGTPYLLLVDERLYDIGLLDFSFRSRVKSLCHLFLCNSANQRQNSLLFVHILAYPIILPNPISSSAVGNNFLPMLGI
jgi:hypothetical protein